MASPPTGSDLAPPDAPRADATGETVPASDAPPASASGDPDRGAPARPTRAPERYRLGKELGRGGMGRVVEAFDTQLGRTVAVKEVLARQGSGQHRRFAREIQLTARLEHPSIVPLYDSGITPAGAPFYVMRRVTGQPLDQRIAQARGLDDRLILLPAVLAAIDAVAHAHKRGVIHRDLKPQNILVGEHGETMVIDWGLAKVIEEVDDAAADPDAPADSLQTQYGAVFGTPGFMSPEQARGEALDFQGDVYALGAVLYQVLAGAPPVAGTSATELMVKTQVHDIRPLAEAAPGVPRELGAIVAKALAFDAANRYPDAGALAEDVRRFLAGQLVAAHAYSPWQKIARFCRRHRGTLSVAAAAMVAVAVMAWIGVHRIVTERDAATAARHDAEQRRQEAEQARDALAERHDALIVAQAASLLDTNPTAAIAHLKQLSPRSSRLPDARAVAQAAAMRGVAWALPVPDASLVTQLELAPDAPLLAATARDGTVRVFALDRRREVVSREFGDFTRADWVAGGKLLISPRAAPPQLYDPVANALEPLALPPLQFAAPSADGTRAAVVVAPDADRPARPAVLDVAARALAPLAFPEPVEGVEIAPDASWVAVAGKQLVVVFDRDGRERTRWRGPVARLVGASPNALLVMSDLMHMIECRLDATPRWVPVRLPPSAVHGAVDGGYRGDELWVYTSDGELVRGTAEHLRNGRTVRSIAFPIVVANDDTVIVQTLDGHLRWIDPLGQGALTLPSSVAPTSRAMRITGRPGARYVAGVGGGMLVVFDLAHVLPRRIPLARLYQLAFVDDDTLFAQVTSEDWAWIDVRTGARELAAGLAPLISGISEVDPGTGRVLLTEVRPQGRRDVVVRRGAPPIAVQDTWTDHAWARLVEGDAIAYGDGDGRVFARIGAQPARLVATLGAPVRAAYALGRRAIVVLDTHGEVTRIDLGTGRAEHVALPRAIDGYVLTDRRGHLYVLDDRVVQRWDGARLVEVARYDRSISYLFAMAGALVVKLDNGELHFAPVELPAPAGTPPAGPPTGAARRILGALHELPIPSTDGRLAILRGSRQQLAALEIPSGVTWWLPSLVAMTSAVAVSPTMRRVAQSTLDGLAVWQLPQVGADYAAWLDAQTNATVDRDGVLLWPWQVTAAGAP